jgi:hypothetical protein
VSIANRKKKKRDHTPRSPRCGFKEREVELEALGVGDEARFGKHVRGGRAG